jgi:hypothetical protein
MRLLNDTRDNLHAAVRTCTLMSTDTSNTPPENHHREAETTVCQHQCRDHNRQLVTHRQLKWCKHYRVSGR